MIRKTLMALAGAAFAASLVTTPASASSVPEISEPSGDVSAAAYSDCPAARMCIWTGLNGTGAIGIFAVGDANLGAAPGPSGLNNNAESMMNRTSQRWCHYDGANYTALMAAGGPGGGANMLTQFRNRITSLRVCP